MRPDSSNKCYALLLRSLHIYLENLVAWSWVKDKDRYLIIVNLSDSAAQAEVQVPWDEFRGKTWRLLDVLSGQTYERNGDEMRNPGLYIRYSQGLELPLL